VEVDANFTQLVILQMNNMAVGYTVAPTDDALKESGKEDEQTLGDMVMGVEMHMPLECLMQVLP
jgi:hypothetical protein